MTSKRGGLRRVLVRIRVRHIPSFVPIIYVTHATHLASMRYVLPILQINPTPSRFMYTLPVQKHQTDITPPRIFLAFQCVADAKRPLLPRLGAATKAFYSRGDVDYDGAKYGASCESPEILPPSMPIAFVSMEVWARQSRNVMSMGSLSSSGTCRSISSSQPIVSYLTYAKPHAMPARPALSTRVAPLSISLSISLPALFCVRKKAFATLSTLPTGATTTMISDLLPPSPTRWHRIPALLFLLPSKDLRQG